MQQIDIRLIAVLVRVDERKVVRRVCWEGGKRFVGGTQSQLDAVSDARSVPVLPCDRGPLLADVTAQQPPAIAETARDADRGMTRERPDLDGPSRPEQLREHGQQRADFE